MAGGLQQALLCIPHQGGLDRRTDESCSCQGASPGGCRRQETEAATRSRWAQEGWAGQARVDTCSPGSLLCPYTDFIMLLLSLTLGLLPPFPGLGSHYWLQEEGGPRRKSLNWNKVSAILHKADKESSSHLSKEADLREWLFLLVP